MRKYTIGCNDASQRLDAFLRKAVPGVAGSLWQKLIREKRVKLNGKRTEPSARLYEGDVVDIYVYEEVLAAYQRPKPVSAPPDVRVVYEDARILLLDKPQGLSVHPGEDGRETDTLLARLQSYLQMKKEWDPAQENSFAPSLCNRIDRNTGGIVIAAKTAAALREMNERIRLREVDKRYLCVVHGHPDPSSGRLEDVLTHDMDNKRVTVGGVRTEDSRTAVTEYRTLAVRGDLSLLECRLITGRTHQIRAQMAAFGHPLLGDGKYGTNALNKPYGADKQALYAYKVTFHFTDGGLLDDLAGRTFTVREVPFAKDFGIDPKRVRN